MPKVSQKKSHQLASIIVEKTIITDTLKHRFVIEEEFARGGFGRIYSGRQEDSKEYGKAGSLAIKVEPYSNGPLFTEITVFQRILTSQKLEAWMNKKKVSHLGLPPYVSSGLFTYNNEKLRFLIMPRYEKCLEDYRIANGGVLDIRSILSVAKQCVDCLSYMQDHDYVHGDLKADNILLASADDYSRCFLVDFGLARMAKGNVDKPDKKRAHNGTLLFTSIDAHRGCAPSFRGDLEILGYNILYWLCGMLPWQKCGQNPESVMMEKEKFSKELDKNIKKLVKDGCVSFLNKLFKLAYETPYMNKVDYGIIHLVVIEDKTDLENISSSLSRKRKGTDGDLRVVLKEGQKLQAGSKDIGTKSPSAHSRIRKVKPVSKNTSIYSSDKSESSGSAVEPPELKRRKSNRIAKQLPRKMDVSSVNDNEQSVKACSSNDSMKKDNVKKPDFISPKKDKKLNSKLHASLKSTIKQNPSSSRTSLYCSKTPNDSPGKKLRNVIPGLHNMKNVRRSLKDTLVKKYITVANQTQEKEKA
uniref:non-specific serine/threonine protein kinase n=1 Tax=Setaria digitata TaxID=48799 RepID=A0A915PV35_9BILA